MSKAVEERQAKVLAALMDGKSYAEIAEHLGIARHLVEKDMSVLMHRHNVKNRVALVVAMWTAGQERLGNR